MKKKLRKWMRSEKTKRAVAMIVTLCMVLELMPAQSVAYAREELAEALGASLLAEPETAASANDPETGAPALTEAPDEAAAPSEETPAPAADDSAQDEAVAPEEATEPAASPADEPAAPAADTPEASDDVTPADEPPAKDELAYPAQDFEQWYNSTLVEVHAADGVLPQDTQLVLTHIPYTDTWDAVNAAVNNQLKDVQSFRLSFTRNGEQITPKGTVRVVVNYTDVQGDRIVVTSFDADGNARVINTISVAPDRQEFNLDSAQALRTFVITALEAPAAEEPAAEEPAEAATDEQTAAEDAVEPAETDDAVEPATEDEPAAVDEAVAEEVEQMLDINNVVAPVAHILANALTSDVPTYTVTFYNRDAEVHQVVEVPQGDAIGDQLPDPIAREDYTAYWAVGEIVSDGQGNKTSVTGDRIGATWVPTADTTVVPDYDQITYAVTFYQEDKTTQVDTKTVNSDTNYCLNDIPAVPDKDGYVGKWVYSGGDFNNTVALSADTNVWAEYEQNVFTATYIVDGETYTTDTYYTGDALSLPADPVVEGKTFKGWFVDGGTGTQYSGGEQVTSDLELTAVFDDMYHVSFVILGDDGTVTERLSQYYRNSGEPIGTMPQDPFVAGKVFEKWVIEGTDTTVASDTVVTGNMTVVAVFRTVSVYNITAEYYYLNDHNEEVIFNTDLIQVEAASLPYTITAPSTTQTSSDQVAGAPIYYPETPTAEITAENFGEGTTYKVRFKYVPYTAVYDYVYLLKDLSGDGYTEIAGSRESDVHGVLNSYVTPTVKTFDYATLEKAEGATITSTGQDGQPKQELNVYYQRKDYTLSYESNGGSYVQGGTYKYGATAAVATDTPTREGYTFDGWYLDEDLTQPAGSSITVEGNTTLYAKWEGKEVNYTIIYMKEVYDNATGTTSYVYENSRGEADGITATVGATVYGSSAPAITLNGYEPDTEFNNASSVVVVADGSSVLTVRYKLTHYKVVFDLNNSNGRITIGGQTYTGSSYVIPDVVVGQDISAVWPSSTNEVSSTGSEYFGGWRSPKGQDGTGHWYITKQYVFDYNAHVSGKTISGNTITWYGYWGGTSTTVTGKYYLQQADGSYVEDESLRQTVHYTGLGSKDIAGYTKYNGTPSGYPSTGDENVPVWVDPYTDTYTDNGGHTNSTPGANERTVTRTVDGVSVTYSFDHSEKYTVIFVGTRYRYVYTGTIPGHYKTEKQKVYYFYYDRAKYTIEYVYNGTTIKTTDPIFFEADISAASYSAVPTAAELSAKGISIDDDYTFAGWFSDDALTTPATWTTMPGHNVKVYAKWNAPTYTVTFETNGGSVVESQTVEKYKKATQPETSPTKSGYTFEGWYKDEACTELFEWTTQITANTTVYAKWSEKTITYTVHYYKDGTTEQVAADKVVTNPNNRPGQSVTEAAISVAGYRPTANTATLELTGTDEENVIIFYYTLKGEKTSYTVKYVIADGEDGAGADVAATKTVDDVPGDTESVVELAAAVDYEALYATHPELEGVEFFPDAVEKQLVLTANDESNVFTFTYSSFKNAKVTVHFVDMNGDQIADSDTQVLKVGKTFTLARTPISGWELAKAVEGTMYGDATAGSDYKITDEVADSGLTFTLFYQKKATITAKSMNQRYNGSLLALPDDLDGQVSVSGLKDGHSLASIALNYANSETKDGKEGRLNAGVATVTPSNAVINGASDGYYKLTYISGTLTVNKINVTIRIEPDRWTGNVYDGTVKQTGFTNDTKGKADYVMISHEGYKEQYLETIWNKITALDNVKSGASAGLGYYVEAQSDAGDYPYQLALTTADMPDGGGNYSVGLHVRDGRLQILPAPVTITTGSGTKAYDGTPLTNSEATIKGLVNGETATVTAKGTITDPGTAINTYEVAWETAKASNYSITENLGTLEVTNATLNVVVKDKTVTYTGAEQSGYDIDTVEGTGEAIDTEEYTVTGLANGDEMTVEYTAATGTNAGTYENGAVGTITIMRGEQDVTSFYDITSTAGKLTIEKAQVTVTANDASKTFGENDPELTAKVEGLIDEDTITYTVTRDAGENVGEYAITPSGEATQGNYAITYVPGTFTINPKAVTVTADNAGKTYGESDPTLTATVIGLEGSDTIAYTISRAEGENVGEYTITPAGEATQGNYTVTYETGTFTITKAKVTVTAEDKTKTYGDADPELTATVTGLKNGDAESVITYTISREAGEDVGAYAITPAGEAVQGNYDVEYVPATLTITKATATVTAADKTKTYGDADPELTATVTGLKNGDAESVISYTLSRAEGEDVGTYAITATGEAVQGNYDVVYVPATLTIIKATVTVTADDKTKTYGDADPELTATVTGLKNGDAESVITYTLSREAGENVGEYTITPAGAATQGNYDVEYKTGTLTITKATVTVTAEDKSKTYGEGDPALTATVTGLKNGDAESVITYTLTREAGEDVGTYTITPAGDAVQGNYDVVYETGTLTIAAKLVTVTANDKTKVYGDADPALDAKVEGLVGNDSISYDVTRKSGEDVGTYTITPAGAATQGNYTVTYKTGTLTIAKATATVTAADKTKTYGDADPALTATVTGLKNGDAESVITYTISREAGEDVGTYAITPAGAAEQGNYDVVYVPATLTITKATVTVTADNKTKTYGRDDPELTATVTGLKNGDEESVISYTLSREAGENVGEYTITPAGEAVQGNYDVEYKTGTLTITKDTFTVTAQGFEGAYDAAAHGVTATPSVIEGTRVYYSTDNVTWTEESPTWTDFTNGAQTVYVKAVNSNYEDATDQATVNITKKAIEVTASDTKEYTGDEQTFTVDLTQASVSGVVDGEALTLTGASVSGTTADTYTNNDDAFTWSVAKSDGSGSTGNYTIAVTRTLTITPKAVTITGASDSKTYDGTALTKDAIETPALGKGDKVESVTVTGSQTDVGTSDNVPSAAKIVNAAGEDVTASYTITYANGTLTVTQKALTITADSDTKVYDGTALTKDSYTNGELAEGDSIESVTVTGSQTVVGSSDNVASAAVIKNADNKDVTDNYNITYTKGTLTVTQKSLTITADSGEKVYDGTALTKDSYTNTDLATGDSVESVTVTGSQTVVGSSDNVASAAVIKNAAGEDVTASYAITYAKGTLEVTQKEVTITADSDEKVYDGTALTKDSYSSTTLADGDAIESVTVTGSQTVFGTSSNVPSAAVIKNAAGTDVSASYKITYVNGTLTVNQKDLTITADSDEKVYDGTALTKDSYTNTDLATGDSIKSVTVTGSQTVVGSSDNVPSAAQILNAKNEDVTASYKITYANGTLKVTQKEVTITADSDSKVYDGAALTKDSYTNTDLATGDSIDSVTVTGSQTVVGSSDNVASAAKIVNAAGEDVTASYKITYANGTLEVTKKAITITADSDTKVYDGTALTKDSYTNTTLATGDSIESVTVTGSQTVVGTSDNVPSAAKIVNADGDDVTASYEITYANGTLTVTQKSLTITADSDSKVYDGTALTKDSYTNTTLATGDSIESVTVTGSQTVVGSSDNVPSAAKIVNAGGEDVTASYKITYANGTLEVTKKALTITADSDSKTYDGKALTKDSYSNGELGTGDSIESVTVTGSQTVVGTSDNVPSDAVIKNVDGDDVTASYKITYEKGTLEVTQKTLTITADSASRIYNGSALTKDSYTNTELAEGDSIESVTVTGSQTVVGTSDNVPSAAVIKNADGDDVTASYKITYANGTLTVTQKSLTITADSGEKVYDGKALTKDSYTNTALAEGDAIESVTVTGSQTVVGTSDNVPSAAKIVNADGDDVTASYDITYTKGTLEVTKKGLTITADSDEKVYDGKALTKDSYTNTDLAEGDSVESVAVTGSQTVVGTSDNVPSDAVIKNADGDDVTASYEIAYANGTLEVTKKSLTITADSDTKVYDGKALTKDSYTNTELAEGDKVQSATVTGSQTVVGKSDNVPSAAKIVNADGEDVTASYEIAYANGTLTVTQKSLTITADSDTKVYDGTALTKDSYTNTTLATGDSVESVTVTGSQTVVGSSDNVPSAAKIVNAKGEDVTSSYKITYANGTLEVTKLAVKVTITGEHNATTYDGTEHTVTGYKAEADSTLYDVTKDFTFSGTAEAKRTDEGTANMGLKAEQFANNNDNFTVTFEVTDGYQTIVPVDEVVVTITGHNNTTDYDGTEHSVSGYDVEISNPLYKTSDFTFTGTAAAARTNAGKTEMGLAAEQFENKNTNFSKVTFNVTDGYQEVTPIDVTVTITGKTSSVDYDGTEHVVTGYKAEASSDLYDVDHDFTFSGTAEAKRTDAGKTDMGLAAEQFTNTNDNFKTVTFNVTDGYQQVKPIDVTVTITGNNNTADYDGEEHTVTGYAAKADSDLYDVTKDFTFSGNAEAKRTDAGQTDMGLKADQFTNNNANFETVTFNVTDGYQKINPFGTTDPEKNKVTVTITGHNNTTDYDGTEHTVSGYEVEISNDLYTEADFTFSGTAEAKRTDAGKTDMGLKADQFKNTNKNFLDSAIEFVVTDGYQQVDPIDVTVTITGNNDTADYDGKLHTVNGYKAEASTKLYDVDEDFTFNGTATASRTDVGQTNMNMAADQFTNNNKNFATVTFNVTDGYQKINPFGTDDPDAKITVTITGHNNTVAYDGEAHTVEGYEVEIDNDLYTTDDFSFSGAATATRTDAGKTNMGLKADQFKNTNKNFSDDAIVFDVTDGYQKIDPIEATVTIVGNNNSAPYDGEKHTVTDYTATASTDLYDVDNDFTFSDEAKASRTIVGTDYMGLKADQFENTNKNFSKVTFNVTDGYQTITPIEATVTIVGATNTTPYDGTEHTVEGYTATASTALFDVTKDIKFTGTAEAKRTDAGKTEMGLAAEQFESTNTNFSKVTFNVTDGYQTVEPIDVTVTITGRNNTATYDASEHTVTGYDVEIGNTLYKEADFTFSGTAEAKRTDEGTTNMGLAAEQFKNTNDNFKTVTFNVTDGYQTITPVDEVVVTITGKHDSVPFDGAAHKVTGYDVQISNPLYKESDFTFSGTAEAARSDAGKTEMGLKAEQFANKNTNFAKVTFNVTDGYQEITPITAIVTITGHNSTVDYDGAEHSVSGYDVETSTPLYKEADFTFSGTAEAKRTDAGKTEMGLSAEQFTNNNANFSTVTFNVTDGYQQIDKINATVTITGHKDAMDYDGEEHGVSGYDVSIDNKLYTEADFTFKGTDSASGTNAGTYAMGLKADQFTNNNANFETVTFNVTDGELTINPFGTTDPEKNKVTVTITGHNNTTDYDGDEHSVSGYDVEIDNKLYKEADFDFSGTAEAKRTDAGKTDMGLDAEQFKNTNKNFLDSAIEFVVTDGYQEVKPIDVTVRINGAQATNDYDGTAHSVNGYTATTTNKLYKVTGTEKDFSFNGTASASRTDAGTTNMGLTADMFVNNNKNFETVTFEVTDGFQTINPIDVTVTIKGHKDAVDYDGAEHTVTGYDVETSTNLYKEDDFTFSGTATASGTNADTYPMGLAADQFANKNDNFKTVTFEVTDGELTINPFGTSDPDAKVTVTITGHNGTVDYDGDEHSVSGYDVSIDNKLYAEKDFTFSGTAEAKRTDAGKTDMGLDAEQFKNINENFLDSAIEFVVTDGYQKVDPIDVTVTITENADEVNYDGNEHTVAGYTAKANNDLYDVTKDFTFKGTDKVSGTNAGSYDMELKAEDFANINGNFANVTFTIVDGQLVIKPIDVTVTITGHNDTVTYDGDEHSVTGYDVTIENPLYKEADFTFSGTAEAKRTDEGTTNMGLKAEQFANTNDNFKTVTFDVTDGYQKITPVDEVVVTITGHNSTVTYDGTEHSVSGYEVEISNPLYKEADFTFSGTAAAARTDAGQTDMGLTAEQFTNNSKNFAKVTFEVTDGYQKVDKAKLTVTADDQTKVYGEDDPTLTWQVEGLQGSDTKDVLGEVKTERTAGENVGTYTITPSGAAETDNYTVEYQTGELTITQEEADKLGLSVEDYSGTYNGAAHTITATAEVTEGTTISYSTDGKTWSTEAPTWTDATNDGAQTVYVKAENPNYKTATAEATVSIAKMALKVQDEAEYTYDGQEKTLVLKGDKVKPEPVKGETLTLDGATVKGTDAGTYRAVSTYTWSVAKADGSDSTGNYTLSVEGKLTIKKADITDPDPEDPQSNERFEVSGLDDVKYNGSEQKLAPMVTDTKTGKALTEGTDYTVSYDGDTTNAGTVTVTITAKGDNYTGEMTRTYQITPRSVTLTSASDSKTYDGTPLTNSEVKVSGDGFVDGEVSDITATGSITLIGETKNDITYTKGKAFKDGNYKITLTPGTLTVTDGTNPGDDPIDPTKVASKTADDNKKYELGEEVTWTITVVNPYSEAKTITLTELEGVTLDQDTFEDVAGGATVTTKAHYTITEDDILAGGFTNTVDVSFEGGINVPGTDPVETEDKAGHLTMNKVATSTPANGAMYRLGETITWDVTATNDGNLTLTDVTVTDELTGDEWQIATLEPGASQTFKASHVVTSDDVVAGTVVNVATAKGTSPDPDQPDVPVDPATDPEPVETPRPSMTVRKTVTSTPANGSTYATGEVVTYSVTVTNNGNVALTDVTVNDQMANAAGTPVITNAQGGTISGRSVTFAKLEVGEARTIAVQYTVLAADAGNTLTNTATAASSTPDTPTPTDTTPGETVTPPTTPVPPTVVPGVTPGGTVTPPAPAPATPAAPAAPAAPTQTIEDDATPQAAPAEPVSIEEPGTPLSAPVEAVWALFNLLAAIVTAVISGVKLFGMVGKSEKDVDDDSAEPESKAAPEAQDAEDDETKKEQIKRRRMLKLASLVPAIAAVVTFILTEDMSAKMVMIDRWTPLMMVYFVVQLVLAVASTNKEEPEDNEPEDETEAEA